jgi:hypothetical protein
MRLRVLEEAAAPADGVHELECPCVYTSMLAVRVPPVGGDTLFLAVWVYNVGWFDVGAET